MANISKQRQEDRSMGVGLGLLLATAVFYSIKGNPRIFPVMGVIGLAAVGYGLYLKNKE